MFLERREITPSTGTSELTTYSPPALRQPTAALVVEPDIVPFTVRRRNLSWMRPDNGKVVTKATLVPIWMRDGLPSARPCGRGSSDRRRAQQRTAAERARPRTATTPSETDRCATEGHCAAVFHGQPVRTQNAAGQTSCRGARLSWRRTPACGCLPAMSIRWFRRGNHAALTAERRRRCWPTTTPGCIILHCAMVAPCLPMMHAGAGASTDASRTAFVLRGERDSVGRLELRVALHAAHRVLLMRLSRHLLQLFGQRTFTRQSCRATIRRSNTKLCRSPGSAPVPARPGSIPCPLKTPESPMIGHRHPICVFAQLTVKVDHAAASGRVPEISL